MQGVKQAKVEGRGVRERAAELIDAGECMRNGGGKCMRNGGGKCMRNGGGMAEYHDLRCICPSRRGARS